SFFLNKYQQAADDVIKTSRRLRWNATKSAIVWGTLAAAGIGGAYLYIIYLATANAIGIGDVVMYSAAVFYAGSSIRSLIQSASTLSANVLSVEKFFDYLDQQPPVVVTKSIQSSALADSKEWVLNN